MKRSREVYFSLLFRFIYGTFENLDPPACLFSTAQSGPFLYKELNKRLHELNVAQPAWCASSRRISTGPIYRKLYFRRDANKLQQYGLENKLREINSTGARLAAKRRARGGRFRGGRDWTAR